MARKATNRFFLPERDIELWKHINEDLHKMYPEFQHFNTDDSTANANANDNANTTVKFDINSTAHTSITVNTLGTNGSRSSTWSPTGSNLLCQIMRLVCITIDKSGLRAFYEVFKSAFASLKRMDRPEPQITTNHRDESSHHDNSGHCDEFHCDEFHWAIDSNHNSNTNLHSVSNKEGESNRADQCNEDGHTPQIKNEEVFMESIRILAGPAKQLQFPISTGDDLPTTLTTHNLNPSSKPPTAQPTPIKPKVSKPRPIHIDLPPPSALRTGLEDKGPFVTPIWESVPVLPPHIRPLEASSPTQNYKANLQLQMEAIRAQRSEADQQNPPMFEKIPYPEGPCYFLHFEHEHAVNGIKSFGDYCAVREWTPERERKWLYRICIGPIGEHEDEPTKYREQVDKFCRKLAKETAKKAQEEENRRTIEKARALVMPQLQVHGPIQHAQLPQSDRVLTPPGISSKARGNYQYGVPQHFHMFPQLVGGGYQSQVVAGQTRPHYEHSIWNHSNVVQQQHSQNYPVAAQQQYQLQHQHQYHQQLQYQYQRQYQPLAGYEPHFAPPPAPAPVPAPGPASNYFSQAATFGALNASSHQTYQQARKLSAQDGGKKSRFIQLGILSSQYK